MSSETGRNTTGTMSIQDYQLGRGMSKPPSRSARSKWLALGIFYDLESLSAVLRELAASGFGEDKFCIARLPAAEPWAGGGSEASDEGADAFGRLLRNAEEVRSACEDIVYAVSPVTLLSELCPPPIPPETLRVLSPPWMTAGQCEQLNGHLLLGAAALIVKSESPAEQDVCSRTMLRHSQHIVRTYDFFH